MAKQQSRSGENISQDVQQAGRERITLGQTEGSYWREQFSSEPYVAEGEHYQDYEAAFRTGYEGRAQYAGQKFDDVEGNLQRDWEQNRGGSKIGWNKASRACRAAWDRADQMLAPSTDRQY